MIFGKSLQIPTQPTLVVIILGSAILSMNQTTNPTVTRTKPRARDLGIKVGVIPTGPLNAITDVTGVMVGHTTIVRGDDIRTGVTAILPHNGNLFAGRRCPERCSWATASAS